MRDERLMDKVSVALIKELTKKHRPQHFDLTRLAIAGNTSDCRTCHQDVHAGQFSARVTKEGCTGCHQVNDWHALKFDHDKDTRFALAGKHAGVACQSCHAAPAGGGPVRYKPLETACASCHADIHAGQMAPAPGQPTDCARCHAVTGWKPNAFKHEPPFTDFILEGKHASVGCDSCHPKAKLADGAEVVRYQGTPRTCAGCHKDPHGGQFKGFEP
jgi:hypothetical protein